MTPENRYSSKKITNTPVRGSGRGSTGLSLIGIGGLRRGRISLSLLAIALLILYILGTVLEITSGNAAEIADVSLWLSDNNTLAEFLVFIGSVGAAMESFHYLHVQRQVDFFESQPVRRKDRFFGILRRNLLTFLTIDSAALLLGVLTAAACRRADVSLLLTALSSIPVMFLLFFSGFMMAALAMMLTGNTAVTVMITVFFNLLEFLIQAIVYLFQSDMLTTAVPSTSLLRMSINPVANAWNMYGTTVSNRIIGGSIPRPAAIWGMELLRNAALGGVLLLLTWIAYNRRKNESAGTAIAFPVMKRVLKYGISLPVFLLSALLADTIRGKTGPESVLYGLIFSLLSSCLLEAIFRFDLRAWKHRFKESLLISAIGAAGFLYMSAGAARYNTWIPSESQIRSAAVYPTDVLTAEDSFIYRQTSPERENYGRNMILKDTGNLRKLAEAGVRQYKAGNADHAESDGGEAENSTSLEFCWRMKDGSLRRRVYDIPDAAVEKYFLPVTYSKAYRSAFFPIGQDGSLQKHLNKCSATLEYDGADAESYPDGLDQLYEEGFDDLNSALIHDYASFRSGYQEDVKSWRYTVGQDSDERVCTLVLSYDDDEAHDLRLPVYKSFTRTVSLLKRYGTSGGSMSGGAASD